jgi:hypothetical protein
MQIFLGVTPYLTGKLQYQGKLGQLHHICFDYQTFGEFIEQNKLDAVYIPYYLAEKWQYNVTKRNNPDNPDHDVLFHALGDNHSPHYALSLKESFDKQAAVVTYEKVFEKIQRLLQAIAQHNAQYQDIHTVGFYLDNELSKMDVSDAVNMVQQLDLLANNLDSI